MRKTYKKITFLILGLILIISLTACSKDGKDGGNLLRPNKDKEIDIGEEFEKLLEVEENRKDIGLFLNEYISQASRKDVSHMLIILEEYLRKNDYNIYENYILLNRYKKYASLEVRAYLNLLFTESAQAYRYENESKIGIEEALARAKAAEDHLIIFPQGETKARVLEIYKKYMKLLIIGREGENLLADEDNILREDIINLYQGEILDKPSKGISNIFDSYLNILKKNKLDISSKPVKDFHQDLDSLIEEDFPTE